ncbi:hypothetical protein [aff. Roholtiella sp. LEGE 12411]|uniref:hypothetical protein n=1 Tax=aff. Roholtiella sp. LEGE 12411 TaxID=1828822 RepID=UPI00187F9E8D|nr:hypothetical protein [aff. Roholtiella sp. LEGE 12411]MBE9037009.1 hypothetical protein [aff. Roholtiella sp. LEGE 12411]
MDTERDFLFLNDTHTFNCFEEGEYLVIQTYPSGKKLRVEHRSFDYRAAKNYCDLESMAHDYTSFDLRIVKDSKLWTVDFDGNPQSLSEQQDWKIAQKYFQLHKDKNVECEIVVCQCSYPYFSALEIGEYSSQLRLETCLVEDNSREIDQCPNCNCALIMGERTCSRGAYGQDARLRVNSLESL